MMRALLVGLMAALWCGTAGAECVSVKDNPTLCMERQPNFIFVPPEPTPKCVIIYRGGHVSITNCKSPAPRIMLDGDILTVEIEQGAK